MKDLTKEEREEAKNLFEKLSASSDYFEIIMSNENSKRKCLITFRTPKMDFSWQETDESILSALKNAEERMKDFNEEI